jgi:hypothetical protein
MIKITNYNNTIIYKLISKDATISQCYIGQTTNFNKRKNEHKYNCNNVNSKKYNYKIYKFIRDNGGWEKWEMIELEKCCFDNKQEAYARERYYYNLMNVELLNVQIPCQTALEYRMKNKDNKREYDKLYRLKNKEYIRYQKRVYYLNKKYGVKFD